MSSVAEVASQFSGQQGTCGVKQCTSWLHIFIYCIQFYCVHFYDFCCFSVTVRGFDLNFCHERALYKYGTIIISSVSVACYPALFLLISFYGFKVFICHFIALR